MNNVAVDILQCLENMYNRKGLKTNLVKSRKILAVKLDDKKHVIFTCLIYGKGHDEQSKSVFLYRISTLKIDLDSTRPSVPKDWKTFNVYSSYQKPSEYRSFELSFLPSERVSLCAWIVENYPAMNDESNIFIDFQNKLGISSNQSRGYFWSKAAFAADHRYREYTRSLPDLEALQQARFECLLNSI